MGRYSRRTRQTNEKQKEEGERAVKNQVKFVHNIDPRVYVNNYHRDKIGLFSNFSTLLLKTKLRALSPRPNYTDRKCHVVSVMDPYSRILGFLDRSRYFFFQVVPQLYS
jgi:hypothetical protein